MTCLQRGHTPKPGCKSCQGCMDRSQASADRWASEGRCNRCGGEPIPGRKRCRSCQDKQNANERAFRARRAMEVVK